jgi:fumarylacetoacetate (FAA) hydrolase family protein
MSDVSKRFEQLVTSTYKKFLEKGTILPVKVADGILVGHVLIQSDGPYKNLIVNNKTVYKDIALNSVAIKIANLMAWEKSVNIQQKLYRLDVEYSRLYIDSKIFLDRYHKAVASNDGFKAEVMWTRYEIAKERAIIAKEQAEDLASFE